MSDDEFDTILQMTLVRHLKYKIDQRGSSHMEDEELLQCSGKSNRNHDAVMA
ncbi:MAG: hypothetical protein AAGC97_10575 [Planctomycetota bacterium]